jgi:hypothetical protein
MVMNLAKAQAHMPRQHLRGCLPSSERTIVVSTPGTGIASAEGFSLGAPLLFKITSVNHRNGLLSMIILT